MWGVEGWQGVNVVPVSAALKVHRVQGCGEHFARHCDVLLVTLILETLTHANRFVRETGFGVCAALVSAGGGGGWRGAVTSLVTGVVM